VDQFLGDIGVAAGARVIRDLKKLEERGNRLRYPHTDSLGDGLLQLRTSHGGLIYRNIFIFRGSNIVILESFEKKTQKTPASHIKIAKQRRNEIDAAAITPEGIIRH